MLRPRDGMKGKDRKPPGPCGWRAEKIPSSAQQPGRRDEMRSARRQWLPPESPIQPPPAERASKRKSGWSDRRDDQERAYRLRDAVVRRWKYLRVWARHGP